MSISTVIRATFQACQNSGIGNGVLTLSLKELQSSAIEAEIQQEFTDTFLACVDKLLLTPPTNTCTVRAIDFIVKYIALLSGSDRAGADENVDIVEESKEDDEFGVFVDSIFERYIPGMAANNKNVRIICSKLVCDISSVALLTDEMQEYIQRAALERIHDVEYRVRVQAVVILARLEVTPESTGAFTEVIKHDPSAETRLSAIYNASGINNSLMETIISRVHDESFNVRKALFLKILPKVDIHVLSIKSRESIVLAGLNDREEVIRKGADNLVAVTWLSMCDNNFGTVLQKLDVIGRPDVADMVVQAFFRVRTDIAQIFQVSSEFFDDLSAESCMLLRGFQDYCMEHKAQRLFDEKMPDLTTLAQSILDLWAKYLDEDSYNLSEGETVADVRDYFLFMIEQLMRVCSRYDDNSSIVDPVVRQKLTEVVNAIYNDALSSASETGTERLLEQVVAIEHKLNNSSDTALILWAFEMAEAEGGTQDPDEAHVSRLLLSLLLFQAVLRHTTSPTVRSTFQGLYASFIAPALASPMPEIRVPGLGCLALACIIDYDFALVHVPKFVAVITNTVVQSTPEVQRRHHDQRRMVHSRRKSRLRISDSENERDDSENSEYDDSDRNDSNSDNDGNNNKSGQIPANTTINTEGDDNELELCINAVTDISMRHLNLQISLAEVSEKLHELVKVKRVLKSTRAALFSLCRLFVINKLTDSNILEDLVCMFFETEQNGNGETADPIDYNTPLDMDSLILAQQQHLSIFIQTFVLNPFGKSQLTNIFGNVLEHFMQTKGEGNKNLVSVGDFVNFYLSILSRNPEKQGQSNAMVALHIIRALALNLQPSTRKSLLSILPKLPVDETANKDLIVEIYDEIDESKDASNVTVQKALEEYQQKLAPYLPVGSDDTRISVSSDDDTRMSVELDEFNAAEEEIEQNEEENNLDGGEEMEDIKETRDEAMGDEAIGGEAIGGEAIGGEAIGGEATGGADIEDDDDEREDVRIATDDHLSMNTANELQLPERQFIRNVTLETPVRPRKRRPSPQETPELDLNRHLDYNHQSSPQTRSPNPEHNPSPPNTLDGELPVDRPASSPAESSALDASGISM